MCFFLAWFFTSNQLLAEILISQVFNLLVKVTGIRPWSLCKTEVHLKISEHKILSLLVKKEIIENNNNLVVISLSKEGENEFLQTLQPTYKVKSLPLFRNA